MRLAEALDRDCVLRHAVLTSSAATAWARRTDRPWLYFGVPEVSV